VKIRLTLKADEHDKVYYDVQDSTIRQYHDCINFHHGKTVLAWGGEYEIKPMEEIKEVQKLQNEVDRCNGIIESLEDTVSRLEQENELLTDSLNEQIESEVTHG